MYRLAIKRAKNESKKTRSEFFRQAGVHGSYYVLLFTDFVK